MTSALSSSSGDPTSSPAASRNIADLTDKVALVTGASSGIGRAIALAYAAAGALVVSADLKPECPVAPILAETLKESDLTTPTVDLINRRYPRSSTGRSRATYVETDVTQGSSVQKAVSFAVSEYGRLDVMVNNAGISAETLSSTYRETGKAGRTHEQEESVFDRNMAINVKGVRLGCKYAAAQMLAQPSHKDGDRGWIINICSIMGIVAIPGAATYCASKGAVLQITKSCGLEYARDKIHVNCINPGYVETNLLEVIKSASGTDKVTDSLVQKHPWGRLALPEDIANMAVFLAGPGASFCTGQAFVVDGGYTAQ